MTHWTPIPRQGKGDEKQERENIEETEGGSGRKGKDNRDRPPTNFDLKSCTASASFSMQSVYDASYKRPLLTDSVSVCIRLFCVRVCAQLGYNACSSHESRRLPASIKLHSPLAVEYE